MDAGTKSHLSALKEALHTLKDSGADGFEGLLASVLSEICGQPFRLASSGSQRGRDGDSAFDAGATYFEAKLYQGDVPRSTVSSKLLELAIDDKGQVDTWVLCATSAISTQHAELYGQSLAGPGIGCLILDWAEHTLPSLAVLLAMTPAITARFIIDHSTDKSKVAGIRATLDAIASDNQFENMAVGLRSQLRDPLLGLGLAKAANRTWMTEAFSDRRQARQYFGQPLAPLDPAGLTWVDRATLVGELSGSFAGVPDETVFLIIGEEGTGKSWLAAKAWLTSTPLPLLVVFTADELRMPMAMRDLESVIIEKLASQTGDVLTNAAKIRWQRRFKGWRANPKPANIRLSVLVDGLNQAQAFPWPRWIDAAGKFLEAMGGRLIITTNERHFAQRLRGTVTSKLRRVVVTEWGEEELRQILLAKAISADRISAEVFAFLRNPRILGIAIELLDAKDIERFEELTVGRLLFEHIRRCERDGTTDIPAPEFAKALKDHADTIIDRLSRQQHDDLKLFDVPLDTRLKEVSNSRFFASVAGEPGLYAIRDDGLPLALGLSLVSSLLKEQRNGHDPAVRLSQIAEPILALATTSEVILSALQVACLDPDCPETVSSALAKYYVSLQNLPDTQWPAFESLVRSAPGAFVQAARNAALSGDHLANMRWLTVALLASQSNDASRRVTNAQVTSWLAYYSLAPEQAMLSRPRHDAGEKVEAERAKLQAEIDTRVSALSAAERTFMEARLVRKDDGNIAGLHQIAFQMLAGTKLAGFADALVNWSFANALNSSIHAPGRAFAQLISLNAADWHETREALVRAAAPLMQEGISRTGQWALVTILRATGRPDDAARAKQIAEELTKDRPKFQGWRLVEDYCATDPCDPASARPENIGKTAAAYGGIDVTQIRQGRDALAQDHFFTDARPGLARFEPQAAIHALRRFARNVTERNGMPRRQGVLSLLPSSAVLDQETVDWLIALAQAAPGEVSETSEDGRDEWITGQYALFAALPHKQGNEQLAIISTLAGRSLLLAMLELLSAADEAVVEEHLERAVRQGNQDVHARVLSFIYYSRSPLSGRARQFLMSLLASQDALVRSLVLAISAWLRDEALLKQIAESGWDAGKLVAKENYFELWHGSSALLAAAEVGLIDPAEAVNRLGGSFYGDAARRLPGPGARMAAARIDAALKKAAALKTIPEFPLIEQPVRSGAERRPPLLSLVDEPQSADIREFFDRVNETEEAFQARQRRAWQAFDRFSKEVTIAEAGIIVDDISWDGLDAIVSAAPALAASWMSLLDNVTGRPLRSLHFFALGLARSMVRTDPARAAALFRRLSEEEPLIRHVIGPSKIPAEAAAVWSRADVAEIKALCFERLDRAGDDSSLSVEVLAAFSEGKATAIREFIDQKLAADIPSTIARALMVAGFSESNPHADEVLGRFSGQEGFIGRAAAAAYFAYERNRWASHWFERMKSAREPEEFWRYGVLFTKIVDGRYALWRGDDDAGSGVFQRFFPTITERMKNRFKSWQDKRQKTLFGQSVPDQIFIRGK